MRVEVTAPARPVPAGSLAFWRRFEACAGRNVSDRFLESFHFDDNEPSANALAALVLAGTKRATAGLVWSFEAAQTPLPAPGLFSIVTDWPGTPVCVIETVAVAVLPYDAVGADFAAVEGEGDGSLRYWRDAHWAYFGRECLRIGKTRSPSMPVVCERFEVVYRDDPDGVDLAAMPVRRFEGEHGEAAANALRERGS